MPTNRRSFLGRTMLALVGFVLAGRDRLAAAFHGSPGTTPVVPEPVAAALDRELLRALGETVLPESLDPLAHRRAVGAFEVWLSEFEGEAELIHPYGGDAIPYGPPDPEPRWAEQLLQLDADARARHGAGFRDLELDERRALVAARLDAEGGAFPGPAEAEHVAVGLMAHYFDSSVANDRAYGVQIGRLECRDLATAGDAPAPLGE